MVAGRGQISGLDNETEQRDILKLSHGIAIVLLFSEFDLLLQSYPESCALILSYQSTVHILFSSSFPIGGCMMTRMFTNLRQSNTLPAPNRARWTVRGNLPGSPLPTRK